jgi:hypothetical protein
MILSKGISKEYTREIQKQFQYAATWFPTTNVLPGDIGTLQDYEYKHVANLKDFNIPYEVESGPTNAEFDYCSSNAVTILSKEKGKVPPDGVNIAKAEAGLSIKFSRNKATVFKLNHCTSSRIKNLDIVGKELMNLFNKGKWDKDRVVVTETVLAKAGTIIISNSSKAKIDLIAQGTIATGKPDLADINAKFNVSSESDIATKVIATKGLTPLFKTSGIRKKKILGNYEFDRFEGGADESPVFGIVDYEDFDKKV